MTSGAGDAGEIQLRRNGKRGFFVRVFVYAVFLISIQGILAGCGYTILERPVNDKPPCPKNGNVNLPDLSIEDISATMHQVPGKTVEQFPENMTTFVITIRNVGSAPFHGSILINYADNERDMKSMSYPLHGEIQILALQVGDSTFVRIEKLGWCKPGTHLIFVLRTDTYPLHTFDPIYYFAREPVCELSYDNNVADFIVP